ncbi:hypothetical protein SLEP1_g13870 [Rubroshorea leprosula]|uniref:Protein kinase domain-containing protein n=1 Tax=Rubroshorea leprosula TaxID=152421 RepID=A0AAV5IHB8_9ROSI|nr:hypothetical protein SLEP1_g13870 [Rubroshorea leprosula]
MEKRSNCRGRSGWTRGKCIGKGSFGSVSVAVDNTDGRVFAVKSVCRETGMPNQIESLENEIRILRSLSDCPYVVNYVGDDVSYESPTTSHRNLHMEYMPGGTVTDMATAPACRFNDVDERSVRWQTRCVVSALKYVHARGIVHCDVKGKNILVGPNSASVKLADFGSAMEVQSQNRGTGVPRPRGSPLWMAPEVIRGEYQGPESDVWSLGCTIIEMVTGKPAWEDRGLDSLSRIGFSSELPEIPIQLTELGRDFVDKCLKRERNQRWSCDQLLDHPYIASVTPPHPGVTDLSPRCVLDFVTPDFEEDEETMEEDCEVSAAERIGKLETSGGPTWESDGWVAVRSSAPETEEGCGEGTSSVYSDSMSITGRTRQTNSGLSGWQCCNYEEMEGLEESNYKLGCGGWSCCWFGPQMVQNREMWLDCCSCNFLVRCNLTSRYILSTYYITFYINFFHSQPQIWLEPVGFEVLNN